MPSQISEVLSQSPVRGTPYHRIAEPSGVQTLPVIDNSSRVASNVRTSVDCYVSGQYVQRNGKVIEVHQRYTIFVAYTRQTQGVTMAQVRDRIANDFSARYGKTFNVSNVFVPALPLPRDDSIPGVGPGGVAPMELYRGSGIFKDMSNYEKARYEVGTEKKKAELNISAIKKRYGVKRA